MLWPEKTLILAVLAGVLYLLGLSFAFEPILNDRALSGPLLLPPCGFHTATGLPCPTCYMTRAFVLMAHGRVADAVVFQPLGAALWVALALAVPVLLVGLFWPRSVWPFLENRPWRRILWFLFLFALASWGYTIVREIWPGSAAG